MSRRDMLDAMEFMPITKSRRKGAVMRDMLIAVGVTAWIVCGVFGAIFIGAALLQAAKGFCA